MLKEMRKIIEKLDVVDQDDLLEAAEGEAEEFENKFLALFSEDPSNTSSAPRVPVFNFAPSV